MPGWPGADVRRLFGFLLVSGVVLGLLLTVLDRASSRRTEPTPAGSAVAVAAPSGPASMPTQATDAGGAPNPAAPNPTDESALEGPSARRAQPDKAGKAEIRRFPRLVVTDAGRLQAEKEKLTIRLHGVSAPERSKTCKLRSGQTWPCGESAAAALRALVGSKAVECEVRDRAATEILGVCRIGTTDLSTWLLRQGWADLSEEADEAHAEAMRAAKKDKLGLWAETARQGKRPPNGQSARR